MPLRLIGVGTTDEVAPPSEPSRPISGTRLSSWWLISKGDQPTHPDSFRVRAMDGSCCQGGQTDAEHQLKVCILALRFTDLSPEDIRGACFLLSFVRCLHLPAFLCSTGITPFLRSYEGSVTFRARLFGPSAGHERRSFPE